MAKWCPLWRNGESGRPGFSPVERLSVSKEPRCPPKFGQNQMLPLATSLQGCRAASRTNGTQVIPVSNLLASTPDPLTVPTNNNIYHQLCLRLGFLFSSSHNLQ